MNRTSALREALALLKERAIFARFVHYHQSKKVRMTLRTPKTIIIDSKERLRETKRERDTQPYYSFLFIFLFAVNGRGRINIYKYIYHIYIYSYI